MVFMVVVMLVLTFLLGILWKKSGGSARERKKYQSGTRGDRRL